MFSDNAFKIVKIIIQSSVYKIFFEKLWRNYKKITHTQLISLEIGFWLSYFSKLVRCRRKAFKTTDTELNAIAAPATRGAKAAIGKPIIIKKFRALTIPSTHLSASAEFKLCSFYGVSKLSFYYKTNVNLNWEAQIQKWRF